MPMYTHTVYTYVYVCMYWYSLEPRQVLVLVCQGKGGEGNGPALSQPDCSFVGQTMKWPGPPMAPKQGGTKS